MHLQSTGCQRKCLARSRSYEGHVKTADAGNERGEGVAAAVLFLYNDFSPITPCTSVGKCKHNWGD